MSLARIQEAKDKGIILLVGTPGAGKSTFCQQVVLRNVSMDRPVILVSTEQSPYEVIELLRKRGLGEKGELNLVDAFTQTVGLECVQNAGVVCANCSDLNSLSIAITRMRERTGQKDTLLVLDSLTSPYLFNGTEIIKFMRLFLSKFVSEGNSVIATIDEGCGKQEDIGAMMSVSDGIMRIEKSKSSIAIEVIKHQGLEPESIKSPLEPKHDEFKLERDLNREFMALWFDSLRKGGKSLREETGDYVNLFWPNLAHWSGMLWDPKGFPKMTYNLNRYDSSQLREANSINPWKMRFKLELLFTAQKLGLYMPKSFSKVKDMKMVSKPILKNVDFEHSGIIEYRDDISKTDEHYFRIYESSDCCGLENIGCAIASHLPPCLPVSLWGWNWMEGNGMRWRLNVWDWGTLTVNLSLYRGK